MSLQNSTGTITRNHAVLAFTIFTIIGIAVFSRALDVFFISDDFVVLSTVLAGKFSPTWARTQGGFFRPLFTLTFFIDYAIWGLRPIGFHLTNLVLHVLNSLLLVLFTRRLVRPQGLAPAAQGLVPVAAGFMFLLHPSHSEAVSWISGRADLLATFFCLLSLLFYCSYLESRLTRRLLVSLVTFGLALLSKESAICLPLLLLALTFAMRKENPNRAVTVWKAIVPFLVTLIIFVLLRAAFIGSLVGGYGIDQHLNFSPAWLRDRLLEASVRSGLPALPFAWSSFLFKPLHHLSSSVSQWRQSSWFSWPFFIDAGFMRTLRCGNKTCSCLPC